MQEKEINRGTYEATIQMQNGNQDKIKTVGTELGSGR